MRWLLAWLLLCGPAFAQSNQAPGVSYGGGLTWQSATGNPYTLPYNAVAIASVGPIASTDFAVPNIQFGDMVLCSFTAAPPAGVQITGVQVVAAGKVRVTLSTVSNVTLSAGSVSINFAYGR